MHYGQRACQPKVCEADRWHPCVLWWSFLWGDLMPDYSDKTKNDIIKIIEDIDLVNSVLNEARGVALVLLEQAERQEG